MPYNSYDYTIHRAPIRNILVTRSLYERKLSNEFDATYWPADSQGRKYVKPGLILAQVGADQSYNYVPYDSGASYGTGSDTAVGILGDFLDVTLGNVATSPYFHGTFIESHCYIGPQEDAVTASVKTDLKDAYWV